MYCIITNCIFIAFYGILMCCIVFYFIVLYTSCIVTNCIFIAFYGIVTYFIVLYRIVDVLYFILFVLYYIVVYCIALFHLVLYSAGNHTGLDDCRGAGDSGSGQVCGVDSSFLTPSSLYLPLFARL